MLLKQLGSIVLAVVVINRNGVAGFFQLEVRFNFVVAAVLTALRFAHVHVPLLLLDDQVSALSVLMGITGLLILGVVVAHGGRDACRLDSVLAVEVLHKIFDASNNGALGDSYWRAPMPRT